MRQIGVRDEAKMLGGYGTCGRPLCCTTFLHVVRAGLDQDGEAAGPEPEPVEAVGPVRPAEVLPALRAAERQRRACTAAAAAKAAATIRPAAAPAAAARRLRLRLRNAAAAELRDEATRLRSPSAIPPASGPKSRARRRPIRACSRSASRSSTAADGRATFAPGVLQRRGRPRGVRRHRRAPSTTRRHGAVDAIATAPSTRKRSRLAGLPWSGHTDLLAHLTGAPHVAMMFYSDALRVVLATVHIRARRRAARADASVARSDDRADGARAAALRHRARRGSRSPA